MPCTVDLEEEEEHYRRHEGEIDQKKSSIKHEPIFDACKNITRHAGWTDHILKRLQQEAEAKETKIEGVNLAELGFGGANNLGGVGGNA